MTTKTKHAQQKKAAGYVADLILDSLERLPKEEREPRLEQVHAALRPKSSSTLNHAAERMTEIVLEQMSTLSLKKARALREEIRKLAGKKSGSKAAALQNAK